MAACLQKGTKRIEFLEPLQQELDTREHELSALARERMPDAHWSALVDSLRVASEKHFGVSSTKSFARGAVQAESLELLRSMGAAREVLARRAPSGSGLALSNQEHPFFFETNFPCARNFRGNPRAIGGAL